MTDTLQPTLAFAAGVLTILSPCVLPLIPIVLGSSANQHRYGPLALGAGLVVSFSAVGFLVAAFGQQIGIDSEQIRAFGAILMIIIGLAMVTPVGERLTAAIAGPLASWGSARQTSLERYGLAGQAGIGALLGFVWSPCVGPTLGAATVLASQGTSLSAVAVVMVAFGAGIASVLVALGLLTRQVFARWRGSLMSAGSRGKLILGMLLIVIGIAIFTGADRVIEALIVDASPEWLVDLTTRY